MVDAIDGSADVETTAAQNLHIPSDADNKGGIFGMNDTGSDLTLTVDIEKPAHGGSCIAHHDGQIIFVRGALPGETGVEVRIDNPQNLSQGSSEGGKRKGFLTGSAIAINGPSPERIEGQCPAHAAGAGCCDLDFVSPEGSLHYKTQVVEDQFARIAHLDIHSVKELKSTSLQPSEHYRQRVKLGVNKNGQIGNFVPGSHTVIPALDAPCAQWIDGIESVLPDSAGKVQWGSEVFIAQGTDSKVSAIAVKAQTRNVRRVSKKSAYRAKNLRDQKVASRFLTQEHDVTYTVKNYSFLMHPQDFWQGHCQATDHYYDWISSTLDTLHTATPLKGLDLYGGAGVFAAALSGYCSSVTSIDTAIHAQEAGKVTLNDGAHLGVEFIAGDVAKTVKNLDTPSDASHVVVVDPPRTGMGRSAISAVTDLRPEHVLHIACDPATGARDVGYWIEHGYELESFEIVDAFPLSHHIELLMHLTRSTL